MSTFKGTTKISGPVSPTSPADTYASHMALYGQGGFRSVQTLTDRDDIPSLRREEGMKVYVIDLDLEYRLKGGIENTNWEEVVFGSSGGSDEGSCGKCNRLIVESLADMTAIPPEDRFKGLSVYVQDTDQEYRLMTGIEDINWVLVSDPVVVATNSSTIVNSDGVASIVNENSYITNNIYENKVGCLNKPLMLDTILSSLKSDFGIYKNTSGSIVTSASDVNAFSFIISNDVYWVEDYIYFKATLLTDPDKVSKMYLKIDEDGIETTYSLNDILLAGGIPNVEVYGNASSLTGYLYFENYGQKNLTIWEEQDGIKIRNLNKSLYIFAQNFTILDAGAVTPLNLTETTGMPFTTKNYTVQMPSNSSYTISLAKVNITSRGINTTSYRIIPSTSYVFVADGTYTIHFDNIRDDFIDGRYALVVTGTENGVTIPTYFYGPFVIDLI